jgi:uncharacterized iron-regulated protein
MGFVSVLLVISGLLATLQASAVPVNQILRRGVEPVALAAAVAAVQPGDVVVLGEEHGTSVQPGQQLAVMQALRARGLKVSVGMEFFDETRQELVDQWRAGTLPEADFLKAIHWGSLPFSSYREQALFPRASEGTTTIALNAPMSLTGQIAKVGIAGLSPAEKAMLPPDFALGNSGYFERFKEVMGGEGHLPSPSDVQNYFAAQSTWDDTMAFNATQYLRAHADQVLVIVVGEFHVQYGGGLPDRLRARGVSHVTTFSLVNLHGLSDDEQRKAVEPDSSYGARADFVWTSDFGRGS